MELSRLAGPVLAAGLLAGLLAGCGAETDEPATAVEESAEPSAPEESVEPTAPAEESEPAVKPASGKRLSAAGVSVSVPRGWADVTESTDRGLVIAAANLGDDETPSQLTVRRLPVGDSARVAAMAVRELESTGHRKVAAAAPVQVDGVAATHTSAVLRTPGAPTNVQRYDVMTPDAHWVVTFSLNQYQVPEDRQRTIDSILATLDFA